MKYKLITNLIDMGCGNMDCLLKDENGKIKYGTIGGSYDDIDELKDELDDMEQDFREWITNNLNVQEATSDDIYYVMNEDNHYGEVDVYDINTELLGKKPNDDIIIEIK